MFGREGRFEYAECTGCGQLTLLNPPERLEEYYGGDYYSFASARSTDRRVSNPVRRWLARERNAAHLFNRRGLAGILARHRPNARALAVRELIQLGRIRSYDARILDVGCGSGQLLDRLASLGFRRLVGIDPFLPDEPPRHGPQRLRKVSLHGIEDEPYDFVMLHHSLEHMPDHAAVLSKIARLLAPDGVCLIRIPIVPSQVWAEYGVDWVELDAPRHLTIHSLDSLSRLAKSARLAVRSVKHEETAFGFWGSELYRRGMSLVDPQTGAFRDPLQNFQPRELEHFALRAADANRSGKAGRAAFVITRAD